MTRRLKKLIKEFVFSERYRSVITLGTSVRLNPDANRLELVAGDAGYPTTLNLFAKTRLTNPNRAKQWLLFEATVQNKSNPSGAIVTTVKYRLSPDGSALLWWNGTAWATPGTNDWNTEAEISANLSTFPMVTQSIQVVVNLATTDARYTPEVYSVKMLYASDIEFQEEYVARSLVPQLREEILPISEFPFKAIAGATTISLKQIETAYDIQSIDAVYNDTVDPSHVVDLYSAYDPTTKTVTWTTPASLNDVIWVRFVYSPAVITAQSQDFTELAKMPAVLLESIDWSSETKITHTDWVVDKATNSGWRLGAGFQCDLDISVRFTADKLKDLDRISDQAKKFFRERLIRARGQDEDFRLYVLSEYTQALSETQSEIHSARLRARICNAVFYPNDAQPVHGVKRFLMNGKAIFEQ